MGPVDAVWLTMDRATNRMVIVALVLLESPPEWERLVRLVRSRVLERYPVFRQRPALGGFPLRQRLWEDDPDFRLERHLRHVALQTPGEEALRRYIDVRLHRRLDPEHPLWEAHLVERADGGAALLCRFHHALADGIALTRVLLSLTDAVPDASADGPEVDAAPDPRRGSWWRRVVPALEDLGPGLDGLVGAVRMARPGTAYAAATLAARSPRVVGDILLLRSPDSMLGGTPGVAKHAVWTRAIPLGDLEQVGRRTGATLNDILMATVAGALRSYQLDHGGEPVQLVTMVPVNVRSLERPLPRELGNRFALVLLTYPSHLADPMSRLTETRRRMTWIKGSPEPVLTYGIMSALGMAPAAVQRPVGDYVANRSIGVTTNVRGPGTVRYLAGAPVTGVLGWVPGSGRQTVGVSLVTYAGTLRVGFLADALTVPDPGALAAAVEDEIERMLDLGIP